MDGATKQNHYLYNKNLRPLARALRKNMTKAEACLWKYVLRAGMIKGHTFNRQRPVKGYITDFLCKKLFLVIEVDGITHSEEETYLKDKDKQRALEKAGFKVVRFSDGEVLNSIDEVRSAVESSIEEREGELEVTSPISPSKRGKVLLEEKQNNSAHRVPKEPR